MATLLEQFVAGHRDAFDGWNELAAALDPADWDRPTGCPGWSVRDNLAHVVALEREMLGEPHPREVELPEGLGHVATDFDRHVERGIQLRRQAPVDTLLDEFRATVDERMQALERLDEQAFGTPAPAVAGATTSPKRFLGIRIFDIWAHQQDARRATGRPGRLTGPAAEIAMDRIRRGVLHYLPQRVDGDGVLVIRVTGDLTGLWAVDLATGEQPAAPPGEARATVTVEWADLVPLACGRADAPDPDEVVAVDGDEGIGRQAAEGLAITP